MYSLVQWVCTVLACASIGKGALPSRAKDDGSDRRPGEQVTKAALEVTLQLLHTQLIAPIRIVHKVQDLGKVVHTLEYECRHPAQSCTWCGGCSLMQFDELITWHVGRLKGYAIITLVQEGSVSILNAFLLQPAKEKSSLLDLVRE